MVSVEFDDGDSGRIPLSHVRMLPQDYPIISDLGSSSIPLERRLRQRNTETGSAQDDMKEEDDTRNRRRRGPKTKSGGSKIRKKKELPEMGVMRYFYLTVLPWSSHHGDGSQRLNRRLRTLSQRSWQARVDLLRRVEGDLGK
ncbi:putative trinucleotide repeat-containing protein 18 protein isoform X 4 [Apostichopus japonicus]|uniref:Putative trinucleotide repeat-containing protein 18 protein isoform X 4 n=1 Tax=Stichopus japonicus TaxID=307972 RepID=A0A2G8LJQ6_STIJA|nr:putative trinucleotide repeat-containing protein 18 protein isoform X 4 [Apostichopus japonicus]